MLFICNACLDISRGRLIVVSTAFRHFGDRKSARSKFGPAPVSITAVITVVVDLFNPTLQRTFLLRF